MAATEHERHRVLSIRGTANLGTTRPLGIAYSPERVCAELSGLYSELAASA